ncbi:MAG: hypothetical protein IJK64_02370 [Clostridia bacterium]|nr:hypothetical protein [Clostridia bacterium]
MESNSGWLLPHSCRIDADPAAENAADILKAQLTARGFSVKSCTPAQVCLHLDEDLPRDGYAIETDGDCLTLKASGMRGWIYAIGLLLRRIVPCKGGAQVINDLTGVYTPYKAIRGHQLGYRPTPNTYDAWHLSDYRSYYLDLMFFGVNTIEHIPYQSGHSERNRLMQYDEEDFLVATAKDMDALDLDLSLWFPNVTEETDAQAAARHDALYARLPRLDAVMIPGSDPGDLPVDALLRRVKAISKMLKKRHPQAKLWVSAQQPHNQPGWRSDFIRMIREMPPEIDGVVMGPNHAYPLPKLREFVPKALPIRFYPDITHNVRCEYPVHYKIDNWHFAFSTGLSRECTNPRPMEFAMLHEETARDVCGSVSYSEGITDDVNKMLWSDLDYFGRKPYREVLLDYARLFFYGADAEAIADAIHGLEINWIDDPAENDDIETTHAMFEALRAQYPFLMKNWRFVQLLLRADCDLLLRQRRRFEMKLIKRAEKALRSKGVNAAIKLLETPFPPAYLALREEIETLCAFLFEAIGLQTDIARYGAENPERGAILETIDLPITDRAWLLQKLRNESDPAAAQAYFAFNRDGDGEVFYSVALHGIFIAGKRQDGEFYLNARGDSVRENNGSLPTALQIAYDHFTFFYETDRLRAGCDYRLRLFVKERGLPPETRFHLWANGKPLYSGPLYGGAADPAYDARFCPPGYRSVCYKIPGARLPSGRLRLSMEEPTIGVQLAALRLEVLA